jgi:hypothetical protein
MRTARKPAPCAIAVKFTGAWSVWKSGSPSASISSLTMSIDELLNSTIFTGELVQRDGEQLAQQHAQTTVAGHGDHLTVGVGELGADCVG